MSPCSLTATPQGFLNKDSTGSSVLVSGDAGLSGNCRDDIVGRYHADAMVAIVGYEHIAVVVKLDILGIIEEGIFNRTVTESAAAGSIETLKSACSIRIAEVEHRNPLSVCGRGVGVKRYIQKPGLRRINRLSVL